MDRKLLTYFSLAVLLLSSTGSFSQMFISEVNIGPDGSDIPHEFIEIRGTASSTIDINTYLVFVEGDPGGSTGKLKCYFDLSGLSFGTNGYLAFIMNGSSYSSVSGATVRTATGSDGWVGETLYVGSGSSASSDGWRSIEDASENILLVTTTDPFVPVFDAGAGFDEVPSIDIDSNDDGVIDIVGWTIHDGISILDNDQESGGNEFGYAPIIFTQAGVANTTYDDSYSNIYEVDFKGGYVCRIGESTGSTGSDWFCAAIDDSPIGTIKSSSSDLSFSGEVITEVGGNSFSTLFTNTTYTSGTLVTDEHTNLTFNGDFSTSSDLEVHDLTINNGQILTINDAGSFKVYGTLVNEGTMIVESGGTLWTYSGKDSDEITFQRNTTYSDGRYSFVGSPVEQKTTITGSDLGPISYYHDEEEDFDTDAGLMQWKNASTVELEPGVGYAQANQELITVTGVPNSGRIVVDVTHTVSSSTIVGNRGFNLVSNPYPSSILMTDTNDEFLDENTNIDGTIYIWDDGGSDDARRDNNDYITANLMGYVFGGAGREVINVNEDRYEGDIRSFQGFFVHVPDNGGIDVATTITFSEGYRNTGDNNDGRFFREEEKQLNIKLSLESKDGKFYNETLVGFREDATLNKDRMYDAHKFISNSDLQLFSYLNDEKMAIQGLPIDIGVSTEIGFDLGESSDLIISVKEINGIAPENTFYLTDKVTGELYNLNETSLIEISAVQGFDQNRFVLTYDVNSILGSTIEIEEPTYRYINNELLVSFNKNLNVEEFSVYDIGGKIISEKSILDSTQQLAIPILKEGINIVRIVTAEGTYIRKFLF